jgi:hypothetical protein
MTYAVNLSALGSNGGTSLATWTTGTRPASPRTGQAGFNTTTASLEVYNGSAWAPAGGLLTQVVQTTGFTAVAGNIYPCNTTSAAFTVTLPASPSTGDQVAIFDYAGTSATNNITVNPNSLKINGSTSNALISTNRESVTLVYVDATQGWAALSTGSVGTSPLPQPYTTSYVLVAAGGGGGYNYAGGGGAGGMVTGTIGLTPGSTYTITIGGGGAGATTGPSVSNDGGNSTFPGITTAVGGGGGACGSTPGQPTNGTARSGGSGGGRQSAAPAPYAGGSGTPGQGNSGGSCATAPSETAGGGGGAGAAGGNANPATSPRTTGGGGIGATTSISGTPVYYAGGGGGGGYSPQNSSAGAGTPSTGGGAAGSNSPGGTGGSGTANTGGGGGAGGGGFGSGGAGGSGIFILSVPTSNYPGTKTGTSTTATNGSNTVITWTGSGSYTA